MRNENGKIVGIENDGDKRVELEIMRDVSGDIYLEYVYRDNKGARRPFQTDVEVKDRVRAIARFCAGGGGAKYPTVTRILIALYDEAQRIASLEEQKRKESGGQTK